MTCGLVLLDRWSLVLVGPQYIFMRQGLTKFVGRQILSSVMAATTMNISLTPELRATIEKRVKSGHYGNASDVIRAGLRALHREEMAEVWREWQQAKVNLPPEPITPEIEEAIAGQVRKLRSATRRKSRR
jgi:putative addiction module CopG family antidote